MMEDCSDLVTKVGENPGDQIKAGLVWVDLSRRIAGRTRDLRSVLSLRQGGFRVIAIYAPK